MIPKKVIDTYNTTLKHTISGRELEAVILMKAAAKLKSAKESMNSTEIYDALQHNQKLWTHFQLASLDTTNPLPDEIKINILNLSLFVDRRTADILVNPVPDKFDVLINVNTNIAMGLRGK